MRTIETQDIQGIFKTVFEIVGDGESVRLQGPSGRVIVMSEDEYNAMAKAQRNAEYLAMLHSSIQQVKNGEVITKTLDELKAMER